jgi:hypothetical protein
MEHGRPKGAQPQWQPTQATQRVKVNIFAGGCLLGSSSSRSGDSDILERLRKQHREAHIGLFQEDDP